MAILIGAIASANCVTFVVIHNLCVVLSIMVFDSASGASRVVLIREGELREVV